MSIASVRPKIKAAIADQRVTTAEANDIVTEVERGRVTVGEAKEVVALFDRQPPPRPPSGNATLAIPEHPGEVSFDGGAQTVMNAFFARHKIPAGDERTKVLAQIERAIDRHGVGPRLETQPDTKTLFEVRLPHPGIPDFPVRAAFIDVEKGEFYVRNSSGFLPPGAPRAFWFGPNKLDASAPTPAPDVSSDREVQLANVLVRALAQGGPLARADAWGESVPVGSGYVEVELMRDRGLSGYTHSALIPVGPVYAGAPQQDPNTVEQFFVKKTGGRVPTTVYSKAPLTAKLGDEA